MAGQIKRFFPPAIILAALALSAGYLSYLYQPLQDGEFPYFANLPAALLGLLVFFIRHFMEFFWAALIALSGIS